MDSNSNHPAGHDGGQVITAATLRALGACARGVRAFVRRWPAGATLERVIREPWRSPRRGAYLLWYVAALAARQEPMPPCDPAALAALARDPDAQAREAAVRHPDCPPEALGRAATCDPDWWVRAEAVRHPACPPEALARAATTDPDWPVRAEAAKHPACPPEVVARVATTDPDWPVRVVAVRHPDCPPAALARAAAEDPDWWVRAEAVRHPSCPPDALGRAATCDSDERVRTVAAHRLAAASADGAR